MVGDLLGRLASVGDGAAAASGFLLRREGREGGREEGGRGGSTR